MRGVKYFVYEMDGHDSDNAEGIPAISIAPEYRREDYLFEGSTLILIEGNLSLSAARKRAYKRLQEVKLSIARNLDQILYGEIS